MSTGRERLAELLIAALPGRNPRERLAVTQSVSNLIEQHAIDAAIDPDDDDIDLFE